MLKGQILLWYGSIATIPPGWALCNGENGTPNLGNIFVRGGWNEASLAVTGGSHSHSHAFTGDGHTNPLVGGASVQAGEGFEYYGNLGVAAGTTDTTDSKPPFKTLAYIMKLHDDPDPRDLLPWPYAAKAIIEHAHQADVLQVWVTFRFKMETDNKPANNLWLIECDGVPKAITASAWLDQWTMLLTIDPLVGAPSEVTVEYDGPDSDLATIWNKQWEPWGPIQSVNIDKPPCFIDRGDPAAYDYALGDLTTDGAWHDMDLSHIVPKNAASVFIMGHLQGNAVDWKISFRKKGNVNEVCHGGMETLRANVERHRSSIVALDSSRKIQYKADNQAWDTLDLVIKGWWY